MPASRLIARLRLSAAMKRVRPLVQWWLQELRGLGEDFMARLWPDIAARVHARPVSGQLKLERKVGGKVTEVAEVSLLASSDSPPLSHTLMFARTVLILPPSCVLCRTLTLPQATRGQLRNVLDLQLEYRVPLRREFIYWDFEPGLPVRDGSSLRVDLAITDRRRVDAWIERLESLGLRVIRVASSRNDEGDLRFDFHAARGARRNEEASRLNRRLAAAAMALALAAACSIAWQWHAESQEAATALSAARAQAQEAERVRLDIDRQLVFVTALHKATQGPAASEVLAELSARLPATAWLTQFELKGPQGRLTGIAPTQEKVSVPLAASPRFHRVSLESSTSLGVGTQRDRFVVRFEVGEGTSP